ncbi:MAG TPA: STAS domain-containing protein [Solirubrobacteraceae bacterium]|nr:STAS domain-containing protein [Solirubrobacteraceae bacterium]
MSASAPAPGGLTISSTLHDGTLSIALVGELDLSGAGQMEASLADAQRTLAETQPAEDRRLVIDLARLSFLDSTGLRLLLQADARAREGGYELVLRPGSASVQRVFEVTGALDVLRFESPPAA